MAQLIIWKDKFIIFVWLCWLFGEAYFSAFSRPIICVGKKWCLFYYTWKWFLPGCFNGEISLLKNISCDNVKDIKKISYSHMLVCSAKQVDFKHTYSVCLFFADGIFPVQSGINCGGLRVFWLRAMRMIFLSGFILFILELNANTFWS